MLPRALETHEKKEVFRKVKESTLKEFKEYAKGETSEPELSKIRVVENKVYIGRKLAVTLAEELGPKTKAYLAGINVQAGQALEAGEILYTTRLYDADELKRFERRAEKLKKELRGEAVLN